MSSTAVPAIESTAIPVGGDAQGALNLAAAKGGGVVRLGPGNWSALNVGSYVTLEGVGPATRVLGITLASNTVQRATIRNLAVVNSPGHGIHLANTQSNPEMAAVSTFEMHDPSHLIENVLIVGSAGHGLFIQGRGQTQVSRVVIFHPLGNGIRLEAFDCSLNQIDVGGAGLEGVLVTGPHNSLHQIKAYSSGRVTATNGDGFLFDTSGTTATALMAQGNRRHGIGLWNAKDCRIEGFATSNGINVASGASGVWVGGTTTGCTVEFVSTDTQAVPTQKYGYTIVAPATANRLTGTVGPSTTGPTGGVATGNEVAVTAR